MSSSLKTRKSDFRHESIQDNKSIQAILKALSDGISKKEITFSDDQESIIMHPKGLLNLKVTATQDDNDNRISIRIKWQTKADKKNQQSSLNIS